MILLRCRTCRREIPSDQCVDLECRSCRVLTAVELDRREYRRLWAKRERLRRHGAALAPVEAQLTRCVVRMQRRGLRGEELNRILATDREMVSREVR